MGLFGKKRTYAFSEILKGLQQAVNSAIGMLQAQQADNLSHFWTKDGKPIVRKVQIGDRDLEVPLITLVPQCYLVMDDVEIKFKAHIGEISSHSIPNALEANNAISHAELQVDMDDIKANADDMMEITVHFRIKDTLDGINRLTSECNKLI
ncbi:DUF2589 domain-containing protein [Parabacteroides merdae]|uniref:DUF2589 domain-containing protein n=1 Tax=Parabacteroides merdae TaxID=46503 RepID=A0A3R6I7B9_9BACT|nr:DUF2589 domain-containing protein [Parabacteroides merdae]RHH80283.1 DUF2589 domain-containing protein [Parabacteroides merdae]